MGREWLYKGSSGVEGCGSGRCGGKSPAATATTPVKRKKGKDKNSWSSGCMSMIFNLFDVQHHQFRFHHPSFMSESTVTNDQHSNLCVQGIEAPRSSLESPESATDGASSSAKVKDQTNLNLPVGKFHIKTKQTSITDELSSQCSNSPGTKTPTLVARLMGLDLLPEYSSPRPSSSSAPPNSHRHSHSLPSTPRISTASRRSTDNDYHHRLSLQIDKENCNSHRGRRRSEIPVNQQDDLKNLKSQYAKEITNQVRERINRRLGTDITNTVSPAICKDRRRDSDLILLKPKKSPAVQTLRKLEPDQLLQFSNSPKLRLLDINSNLNKPVSKSQSSSILIKEVKPKSQPTTKVHKPCPLLMKNEIPVKDEKIKRIASERYDLRLKKKSTKLHNHVLNVKNSTKILSCKKEMTSSSSPARSSKLQVSLPSTPNSPYKVNNTHHHKTATTTTTAATATATAASFSDHFNYITKILNQCGITSTTPITSGQWHSNSHPLHPSLFHHLEKIHHPTTTTTTATRRIIFDYVNNFLVEILKPKMTHKPNSCLLMHGDYLIKKLCENIRGFPAAHCEALDDIDGLIAVDIGRSTRRLVAAAVEMEVEGIVKEIESEIVESLVHEIARWQVLT